MTFRSCVQGHPKRGFELTGYGLLFAPQTTWTPISDRLATTCILSLCPLWLCPKWVTLKYGVQGQSRWNVKTDFAAYGFIFAPLLPIQYGHLTLTIRAQHAIFHCALCPTTDDLELWVSRSTEVKSKDGFELAAYEKKKKKSHQPYISPPRRSVTANAK